MSQVGDDLKLKLERSVYLEERMGERGDMAPWLNFPNIGKVDYFQDRRLAEEINAAEEADDLLLLDSLLTVYISQFGVSNFYKDVELIWRAGQVKEVLGDTAASLLYYELGIRNQRPAEPKVKVHYEKLRERTHNYWVDLDFYYRILEARREMDPLIPPKGVLLNMGPKINSDEPDYAPYMHPSDSVVVFTSRRTYEIIIDDFDKLRNEDLYYAERDYVSGVWGTASHFSNEINSEYNEGSACLSPDGRTLYFTRCDAPTGMGSCDIYSAEFRGGRWTNIQNLGANVNSDAWDSHPNVTPDGDRMYFTSNRRGGFGKSDLYVCQRQDDGTWGPARNLGPEINTIEDEVTPFFHKVNQTLYFSSTGHILNMGGYDIYKARWFGDHWEVPKNVGPLVNSPGNEYYFSIDGKGEKLFYAKAKADDNNPQVKQNFDLYSFPMPMEARPDAIVTLKGVLVDSASGNPITGIVLVIDRSTNIEVAPKHINRFGYFEFDLIRGKQYDVYIQGENFLTIKEELYMKEDTSFTVFTESFTKGKPLVFESMEFEEDSYDLGMDIEPQLNYIAAFLKRYPMFTLVVKGHTDSDGEARYNLELSQKRANVIRKYIVKRGDLDERRVSAKGFGESRPLVPNDTEEHKHTNRRVEFEIFLDPEYDGPIVMPTEDELYMPDFDEELLDPEFMEEDDWEFDWEGEWDTDLEEWDGFDLEEEDDLLKEYDDFEGESWDDWDEDDFDDFDGDMEVDDPASE